MTDFHWDFEVILTLLAVITGLGWLLDKCVFAKRRRSEYGKQPLVLEWCQSFFPVIFLVLVLRSFIIEPFRIPSGSMLPTLHIGDFILVNKFTWGIRLPVTHHKIIDLDTPERGDIAVFRYPEDQSLDYIKRIVGVPGDVIAYKNKVLYVNDVQAKQEYQNLFSAGAERFTEMLPDNIVHDILIVNSPQRKPGNFQVTVPADSYFTLGDNRDRSQDSRYWGFVPESHLVGKAFFIWMNWDSELGHPDWQRIGTTID